MQTAARRPLVVSADGWGVVSHAGSRVRARNSAASLTWATLALLAHAFLTITAAVEPAGLARRHREVGLVEGPATL